MTYKKGESGNRAGRSIATARKQKLISELLLPHVDKAIAAILSALEDEDASVRLAGAKDLLNRVYGMPKQVAELSGKDGGPLRAVIVEE